ncbi:MAG: hypothetical protein AAHH96_00070 [Candidatus Symbiodolus clandestinus]
MINAKKWIDAGKALAINPNYLVPCPNCGKDNLKVHDIRSNDDPFVIERFMNCERCRASNSMRLIRPSEL